MPLFLVSIYIISCTIEIQVLVVAILYGFKSLHPHQKRSLRNRIVKRFPGLFLFVND